jgi:diguanylate cyclase (GGDEF)-like protein/PAS domain S-box-containing protein
MSVRFHAPSAAEHPLAARLRQTARLIGLGAAGFGMLAIALGAVLPASAETVWLPNLSGAVFLLLSGLSLYLQVPSPVTVAQQRWSKLLAGLAGLVVLISGLAASPWFSGELPAVESQSSIPFVSGLLTSLSLLTLEQRGWRGRLGWLAALIILSFALFVLIDYLYAFRAINYVPVYRPLTLPTATAYALLGLGLLLANPAYSPTHVLQSNGPGGLMVRRLLLPALALPLLLLWLLRLAIRHDALDLSLGYSLTTSALIILLAAVICYQAKVVDRLAAQAQRELDQAEASYLRRIELAVEAAELYLWEIDPHSGQVYHSGNYIAELGYQPDQATSHLAWWSRIIDPSDLQRVQSAWQQLLAGAEDLFQTELRVRSKHGEIRWMYVRAKVVAHDPDGRPQLIAGVLMDITERRQVTRQLADTQAKLRLAMDIAAVGYWEMNPRTYAVEYSPEWKRLLGYADTEIANDYEEWISRLHPDDHDLVLTQIRAFQTAAASDYKMEFRLRHKDGSYRWIASRAVLTVDEAGTPIRVRGVHLDITERKEIENRIRQISQHDPLTGLPNRALLHEFAEPLLAAARRNERQAAVLFVDLDHFKPINDQHGHDVGDEVLKEVARRLRTSVRESDLVGRLGGDEFLLVLADIRSEESVNRVARLCLERLSEPHLLRGLELRTTCSIGISLFPQDGDDLGTLIHHADAAMYQAKHGGRNKFQLFHPALSEQAR